MQIFKVKQICCWFRNWLRLHLLHWANIFVYPTSIMCTAFGIDKIHLFEAIDKAKSISLWDQPKSPAISKYSLGREALRKCISVESYISLSCVEKCGMQQNSRFLDSKYGQDCEREWEDALWYYSMNTKQIQNCVLIGSPVLCSLLSDSRGINFGIVP